MPTRTGGSCKLPGNPTCRHHTEPDNTDCSICLHSLGHTRNTEELRCGHKFHKRCIQQWLRNSCPLCRAPTTEPHYKITIVIENLENGRVARSRLPPDILASVGGNINRIFGIPLEAGVNMVTEIDLEHDILENLMNTLGQLGIDANNINLPQ